MVLARYFVKKDLFSIVGMALCLVSVGFLYSRTAYVTVVASFFLYLFLSRRTRFFPVLVVLGVAASLVLSETIIERATKGLESSNLNEVASGRLDHQWLPLAEEYSKTPVDFLLGRGRFALFSTKAWQSGILPGATHPHNMYIEMILDGGLISLFPLLAMIAALMLAAYRWLPHVQDPSSREYLCGGLVAIICYLMGGMTTGSLFPTLENSGFWLIAGITVVIIKHAQRAASVEEPV
jgi:O-antigen ligase